MNKFIITAFLALMLVAQNAFADTQLFTPIANTVALASQDTSSDAVALGTPAGYVSGMTLRVVNNTDKTIFILTCASSSCTAVATTGMPVLGGSDVAFSISGNTTYAAGITASGTATGSIYFTLGQGE